MTEFRYPVAAAETNALSLRILTSRLSNPEAGRAVFEGLLLQLGNTVEVYPDWHPLLTLPQDSGIEGDSFHDLSSSVYAGLDHTVLFISGFVTCPYSQEKADKLVRNVNAVAGLNAYRLETPLYSDQAYPVVVEAVNIELEGDGTIRGRDVLSWSLKKLAQNAEYSEVAETWWTIRSNLLGQPHGSRSSLFVNQNTGSHLRKILEVLNDSGVFGPIKEWSLDMLSKKKRDTICKTLIMTAVANYRDGIEHFEFELCGEECKAKVRDVWRDNTELQIEVEIGNSDLIVSAFYHPQNGVITPLGINGKRSIAEKYV